MSVGSSGIYLVDYPPPSCVQALVHRLSTTEQNPGASKTYEAMLEAMVADSNRAGGAGAPTALRDRGADLRRPAGVLKQLGVFQADAG